MNLKKCNHPLCAPVLDKADGRDYFASCKACHMLSDRSFRLSDWGNYVAARNALLSKDFPFPARATLKDTADGGGS